MCRTNLWLYRAILVSIVVSIPACHAGDRGSIPRRGELNIFAIYGNGNTRYASQETIYALFWAKGFNFG